MGLYLTPAGHPLVFQIQKTHAPVPVRRDGAYSNSQETSCSTSRKRFLAIGSQSFAYGASNNAARERFGEFRFNCGSVEDHRG